MFAPKIIPLHPLEDSSPIIYRLISLNICNLINHYYEVEIDLHISEMWKWRLRRLSSFPKHVAQKVIELHSPGPSHAPVRTASISPCMLLE